MFGPNFDQNLRWWRVVQPLKFWPRSSSNSSTLRNFGHTRGRLFILQHFHHKFSFQRENVTDVYPDRVRESLHFDRESAELRKSNTSRKSNRKSNRRIYDILKNVPRCARFFCIYPLEKYRYLVIS